MRGDSGKGSAAIVRFRRGGRTHDLGEMRDHSGVDRVGLGQLPERFTKPADLSLLTTATGRPASLKLAATRLS
jgi:hypothetical protein